jgi:hypothetical protein
MRIALACVVVFTQLMLFSGPAAADCSASHQVFVEATNNITNQHGTINRILLRQRDLDNGCTNPKAVSTAHFSKGACCFGLDWATQIEIGWIETHGCCGQAQYKMFTEKEVNGDVTQHTEITTPNLDPGTFDVWKIASNIKNPDGSTDWDMKVDFLKGNGFVQAGTFNTLWHYGESSGETEGFGSNTGMHDEQRDLQLMNDNRDWVGWSDLICNQQIGNGIDWQRIDHNDYDVSDGQLSAC